MASRSSIHELEKRERRGRWFVALATLLSIALLASTWVGLFAFMTTSAAFGSFEDLENRYLPDVDSELLILPDLSRVSQMYTLDNILLAELHDGRVSDPVPIDEIPQQVVLALLAAEDADFFEHEGVDLQAIASAFIDNIATGNQRGGSTITQQVVKKVFVGDEISYERKLIEAITAIELERRYEKEQILEFYANFVYFGSSAYGISAAAHEFFAKPLDQLTLAEAATLAVLPRSPGLYDPRRNPDLVLERRNDVLATMANHSFITAQAAELAQQAPFEIAAPAQFTSPAEHVVAEVKRQLLNDAEFAFLGATNEERKKAIFGCPADDITCVGGGGLKVYVTIDLDLQNEANRILSEWFPVVDTSTLSQAEIDACIQIYNSTRTPVPDVARLRCFPTGAISTVEAATGAVRVMASGLPFAQEQFDLAVQGHRNPGSSFKPFALVAALESGIPLYSYWDSSSPKEIECPYTCSDNGNIWTVSNAGGGGSGLMRLDMATQRSVNVVYAQLALAVGPERLVEVAHRMGIQSELAPVPSLALGAGAVSPLEMASAYTNFSTNGLFAAPYLVERIETSDGTIIHQHLIEPQQVVDAAVIAAARKPLLNVPTSEGTAPRANIGRPQGGKTGTHQNFNEAWFLGFVPQYATAVWTGFPDFQWPLRNVTIHGEVYSRVFGGSVPAPIWKEFMQIVLADVPVADFPPDPPGVSEFLKTPTVTVPSVVGMMVGDAKRVLANAHLGINIIEVPSYDPIGTVLGQAPAPGEEIIQNGAVSVEVASGETPGKPLPDLIFMTVDQVSAALRQFEAETGVALTFKVEYVGTPNPEHNGLVLVSAPGRGIPVSNNDEVTVVVGIYTAP